MKSLIAALPMYDWPERRVEVDAEWAAIRHKLEAAGLDAPTLLVRRNADMPAVPGGIRDASGGVIAPDPATLPPDDLDLPTLWRHPVLLFGQTCWGPMEHGLAELVGVVGQPDYSDVEGGEGKLYSSAIVMRAGDGDVQAQEGIAGTPATLPLDRLRGKRFAYNSEDSMSGYLALSRDLESFGGGLAIFGTLTATGSHRASVRAVALGDADVATIDCRSWALARLYEPAAAALQIVGWTKKRPGLPFIAAPAFADRVRKAFQPGV